MGTLGSRRFAVSIAATLAISGCARAEQVVWSFDNLQTIAGNPVAVAGDPRVIDTPNGKAIEFDGVDDGIFLDVHPLAGMPTFTVEVIFKPYAEGASEQRFFHMQEDASDDRVMFETRLVGDDLHRQDQEIEDHALFLRLVDLHLVGRHLGFGAAVEDVDVLEAQTALSKARLDALQAETGLRIELGVSVPYSSTCPCSAALSRKLAQQHFLERFPAHRPLDRDAVADWIASPAGMPATPHSQRSHAHVRIAHSEELEGFPFDELVDAIEHALATPVQSAVKREDEQAFAELNNIDTLA